MAKKYKGQRVRRSSNPAGYKFLIVAGVLLFLANMDLLPISIHELWKLWPLFLVFNGVSRISQCRAPGAFLMGGVLVVLGVVFTLGTTGLIHFRMHGSGWIVAVVLLSIGLTGLAKVLDGSANSWRQNKQFGSGGFDSRFKDVKFNQQQGFGGNFGTAWGARPSTAAPIGDRSAVMNDTVLMGNIERNFSSQQFEGGTLSSVLGNIEIDMRRCAMAQGKDTATVDVSAVMGNVKLRVPEAWRVIWAVENVLGAIEDKTFPPITGAIAPRLVITGSVVLGHIEIEN